MWGPFSNPSEFLVTDWAYNHDTTSYAAMNDLVQNVILSSQFDPEHLRFYDAKQASAKLDNWDPAEPSPSVNTGWISGKVRIPMPHKNTIFASEEAAPHLEIDNICHRKLIEVIQSAFQDSSFSEFDIKPFKYFWKPSETEAAQRVYGETYSSTRALDIEKELYYETLENSMLDSTHEPVIAWLQLWSDSTHLADFGTASLWPIYLYFGNLSKYVRGKSSSHAAHHLAYIPSLPDIVDDIYAAEFGEKPTDEVKRFLKRDLFQAILFLLMDDEFVHAYVYGILIKCFDGILRRIFPRFFSYSADYPELILIACIKYLANCLCPRCTVHTSEVSELGKKLDMRHRETKQRQDSEKHQSDVNAAREKIFKQGRIVEGEAVKKDLDKESYTTTRNAFSQKLFCHGFDHFRMYTPDMLHFWSGGKWSDVFKALLRMLQSLPDQSIQVLDQRYRWIPTFGRAVIRQFSNNVSALKQLAGHDMENVLQCALPCFELMFPKMEDDAFIQDLLFTCATWHGFGKLRLQFDATVTRYTSWTTDLGEHFRELEKMNEVWDTKELPKEAAARNRRAKPKSNTAAKAKDKSPVKLRRKKKFNNSTAKTHLLGYFPMAVKYFGTLDSYDTRIGESEHRRVKRLYKRTNRRRHAPQIAKHEYRGRVLRKIRESLKRTQQQKTRGKFALGLMDSEPLPFSDPSAPYQVATGQNFPLDIRQFMSERQGDLAMKDFYPKLKHQILYQLFSRLLGANAPAEITAEMLGAVIIKGNRLYRHKVVRINYTTYDLQRDQDSINPRTHPDIITLSPEGSSHPFTYGRVIGIFHVNVSFSGTADIRPIDDERVDCLWVRWYQYDESFASGFKAKRLPRISFMDPRDSAAFDFLDPVDVIRAAHLIPTFVCGDVEEENPELVLPADSVARQYEYLTPQGKREVEPDDWSRYYVNMFPDRDTFALFLGGGIGHQHLREHLREFAIDAGLVDQDLPAYDSDGDTVIDEQDRDEEGDESSSSNEELDEEDVLSDNSDGSLDDDEEDPADDDEEDPADDAEGWLGPEDGEERTEEDVDEELGL
ncbi:hypothetical protein BT96DRAFT_1062353 [Gymnopus androsaceus JB14]|uniref:Uncharacterized protein n=1 Tax=Gymnopus androsaceus JB14 TaxID=1447944 RepID=A0A6A4H098_9AGAR|nr:hypothetical protein BT96DRAFT_1062353 [Gymnopus androsaceus JB14]